MEAVSIHSQEQQQLIKIKSDSADEADWWATWVTGGPGAVMAAPWEGREGERWKATPSRLTYMLSGLWQRGGGH